MADAPLPLWVALFIALSLYLIVRHWRDESGVGLMLAYVVSFGVLHGLTPILYLLPWYWNARLPLTEIGLHESTFALLAVAIGAEIAAFVTRPQPMPVAVLPSPDHPFPPLPVPTPVDPRVVTALVAIGLVMYVVVLPLAGYVPSLTAVASAGSTLALAGVALKCWNAWEMGRPRVVLAWLAACGVLPWVTVITQGFLGFGFAALLVALSFVAAFYRPRWKFVAASLVIAYLGLSTYVTYMRDRREIRAVVWTNAQMSSRFDRLVETVNQAESFNIANTDHLDRIEKRLNQDALVGAAISYLKERPTEFASGETLWEALAAIVPRALWPDKPVVAGSGDLVSRFTGIRFADDTSVGIGQVMESYVNFGRAGVIGGFLLIGALLASADRFAFRALRRQDAVAFTLWFLPGLSLLQVGGSFVELTSTAAAAVIVALAVRQWASRLGPPPDFVLDPSILLPPMPELRAAPQPEAGQ